MENYNSFRSFSKAIKDRMESKYDCSVHMDEMLLDQSDDTEVGFQRDDLYRFMLLMPNDQEWKPSKLYAYLPEEIDRISDRPGVPVVEIDTVSVEKVIERMEKNAPEYEGEFEYDESTEKRISD